MAPPVTVAPALLISVGAARRVSTRDHAAAPDRSRRWAVGRTFGSLGMLFPLVTRALPLLLLFVTFLFINTEVWMVANSWTVACCRWR